MFSNDGNLSVHHFGGFQGMSGSYAWPPTLRGHLDDDIIFPIFVVGLMSVSGPTSVSKRPSPLLHGMPDP